MTPLFVVEAWQLLHIRPGYYDLRMKRDGALLLACRH